MAESEAEYAVDSENEPLENPCNFCSGNHRSSEHLDDVRSEGSVGPEPTYTYEQMLEFAANFNRDNEAIQKEILSLVGQPITGVGESRHEMLFAMMSEVGMLPKEFVAAFELRWASHFNTNLRQMRSEILEAKAQDERERLRQQLLHGTSINPRLLHKKG
jgi:hypothetical protein